MTVKEILAEIRKATKILRDVEKKKGYTIDELKAARHHLLAAVRYGIDPLAFGHLPTSRHY